MAVRTHTARMSAARLARAYAAHHEWRGTRGGWIVDREGRQLVQGWTNLTGLLVGLGVIEEGTGILWGRERALTPDSPSPVDRGRRMGTRLRAAHYRARGWRP